MLKRLQSSVQRMSQFTADASHELRAPVSVIRTTAELAVHQGRTPGEYHEDMVQILGESERISRLIDSLMVLARADSEDGGLRREPVNVSEPFREAANQARNVNSQRLIGVSVNDPLDPIIVYGDSEGLRRLFLHPDR
jgi:two-component system heavy metal sensor histidine kinase CusS